MYTPTPTPIKYVPKKINGALMWAPVYKKGEGPSVPTTKPAQPVSKKVETEKSTVPPGYLKKYREEHREVKKGTRVVATCRICDKLFAYTKSEASRPRNLCGVVCAYQAQKNSTKEYEARKRVAATAAKDAPLQVVQNNSVPREKTTICKGCGKSFQWKQTGRHAPRKFCEARCRTTYQSKKQADQWRVDRTTKYKCRNCDKDFSQKNLRGSLQKYCSKECRVSYWSKNSSRTKSLNRDVSYRCRHCNNTFLQADLGPPAKYCTEKCRTAHNNSKRLAYRAKSPAKPFMERVAEHLPPPVLPKAKETTALTSSVQPPSWEALTEEASVMGVVLEKEPPRGQSFYIALLMARRARNHEEWKKLLKTQDVRIRQLPETYTALRSVSGEGAIAAARALKTRMGM